MVITLQTDSPNMTTIPDFLSHYYEADCGPFLNLSDLPLTEAAAIQETLRQRRATFAGQRASDYLEVRRALEDRVRALFIAQGGKPQRQRPHYMILGACSWLKKWYQQGCELRIPLANFSPEVVSFTYGDTFPAMRCQDDKPYRGRVYTLAELPDLITRYGLPQDWNTEGQHGPDRYIEAQVWCDEALQPHLISLPLPDDANRP
ncbi:hypothetical protein ACFLYO_09540 [Chloroflexota bacterium]